MNKDERAPVPKCPPGSTHWLIAKDGNGPLEVFTIGEEALAVFSFREEAEMYLRLGGMGDGWRVKESSVRELVSMLYAPCARVERVAFDPLPATLEEKTVGPPSLSRKRFLDCIMAGGGSPRLRAIRKGRPRR